ncbi:CU044_5270 family protein [Micromonospora sp. NBC_01796]|uniref:CU044_5270 family protein n=1 Tax=Micromonospora sp. NBC_01796 TaxID=2975987 RepID=UPI002DD836BA|nr:CU044_5270 family protein [Micromonospora sp. NBC_01796]WSA83064.1 CU044_5270 family protein [Micromonospora sp. NBC_01796]
MTDDITTLRERWHGAEPPSPDAQNRARAALMARIARTDVAEVPVPTHVKARGWRLRGWAWRSGIATVAAAAVAFGLVTIGGPAEEPDEPYRASGSAAVTFELAAAYAEAQPFTPPRPDQWTYVELRIVNSDAGVPSKGLKAEVTTRQWSRADGKQTGEIVDGALQIVDEAPGMTRFPPTDYPTLAALPTDPHALLDWLRARTGPFNVDTEEQRNTGLFSAISTILRSNLLPPAVMAALLRAAALIPGVAQAPDPVSVDGRTATAVGRLQDGWRQEDLLLDPGSHEFIGYRSVAAKDFDLNTDEVTPEGPIHNEPVQVKKGDLLVMLTRLAGRIVDAPGQIS